MAKAKVLYDKKTGQAIYPYTDASLIIGLKEGFMDIVEMDTLPTASKDTRGKLYFVPSENEGEYDRYVTKFEDGAYTWQQLTDTTVPSPEIVDDLETNNPNKALSAKQGKVLNESLIQLGQEVGDNKNDIIGFKNVLQGLEGDELYITDKDGNVVARIDADGIHTIEVEAQGAKLSGFKDILPQFYNSALYVTDGDGNVVFSIDADGLRAANCDINAWAWKRIATYGDSVVAINNGDFSYPYVLDGSQMWANRAADFLKIKMQYGRGIGGQKYAWGTNGGSVAFIKTDSGQYDSRNDSYNLDNYTGAVPAGCAAVRGCLSSWLRITTMFPASIKDTIDAVIIMAHNDAYDTIAATFVANDTTDPEWAASGADYYERIGGDYNITTLRGGIASTIMKLQMWMPNAIIILSTGISGSGTTGQINTAINSTNMINIANAVREMSVIAAVPCIDSAANDGINGWNRTTYISDTIHPYTVAGSKMIARSIIGGMKTILPNL